MVTENTVKAEKMLSEKLAILKNKKKEKQNCIRDKILSIERALSLKLSSEHLEFHKKEISEYCNTINNDITTFNRVISGLEDKLADNTKKIVRCLMIYLGRFHEEDPNAHHYDGPIHF